MCILELMRHSVTVMRPPRVASNSGSSPHGTRFEASLGPVSSGCPVENAI